jgi:uncharacterized protein
MMRTSGPGHGTRAFVAWTLRHGRLLWLFAALLAVPAVIRTVSLYEHLKSDIEELLPRESPSVRALDEMRARIPGLQYLGVVVDIGRPENLPAGERLLDDLAARIRAYPTAMVRDVRTGNEAERAFLEKHAPLYMEVADLREVLHRIEARRDYEVERESGSLLDDSETPPSIDVSDIEKKYDQRMAGERSVGAESGRFSDAAQKVTMLFVEAQEFTTGANQARALLNRVQADVRALGGLNAYAPGMRIGYCSDVAISVEELDALETDLSVSSILVIVAEIAVIVLYYRWWRSIVLLFPPLLLATVYAFAIASLPPGNVTELNSNTAFLGSIIVGNGINVGIVLLARYREARRSGASVEEALVVGVWGARLGTLAAALAAAAAYASLIVTEFRGFRQFGYIGGTGMVASWVTAFVLVPPLIRWVDRDGAVVPASERRPLAVMRRVAILVDRWPLQTIGVALAFTAVSALAVFRFDASTQVEYDLSKLRRIDTWETGDGYWGRKVNALLGRYPTPTVVLSDSASASSAAERAIRESAERGPLQPMVASVRSVDDVLPREQEAKIEVVRQIRDVLTPKIRTLVDEGHRKKLDKLVGADELRPLRIEDLPRSFTTGLRERDGSVGRTVLVYPRPSDALWRAKEIHTFVRELRDAGSVGLGRGESPGRVAGSIPLSGDIIASIGRDAPLASLVSFAGVVAVVVIVLRARLASLYVIGSLVVGLLWLAGATMLLHIKINFCNFVAYPITVGIGVDYSVNVITRYFQDGARNVSGAVRSTGAAVGLCSLTTMIGYSSLLLAKNRALYLFGLTAVLGEIACLTAAVVALPACLVALRKTKLLPMKVRFLSCLLLVGCGRAAPARPPSPANGPSTLPPVAQPLPPATSAAVPALTTTSAAAPSSGERRPADLSAKTTLSLPGAKPPVSLDYIAYDRAQARVWVPVGDTGSVDVLDVTSGSFGRVDGFKTAEREVRGAKRTMGPSAVALGDGFAYIGNRATSEVCVVDAHSLKLGLCLTLPSPTDGVAYIPSTKEVWVTTPRDHAIAVLDASKPESLKSKTAIHLDGAPEGYAVDDSRNVFFTNLEDKNRTVIIDTKTHKPKEASWKTGCGPDGPRGIAADGSRGFVFVACTDHVEVLALDGNGGAPLATLDTGAGVDNIDWLETHRLLFVAAAKAAKLTVAHIDNNGQPTVVAIAPTAQGARNGVADAAGKFYLPDPRGARLLVFELP